MRLLIYTCLHRGKLCRKQVVYCLTILVCHISLYGQSSEKIRLSNTYRDTQAVNALLKEAWAIIRTQKPDSLTCKPLLIKALHASKDIKYTHGLCRALIGLAIGEIYYGNYPEAFVKLKEAESLNPGSHVNHYKSMALIANARGVVYDRLGMYDSAINHYLKEITALEKINASPIAYAYTNTGQLFMTLGLYDKAKQYLNIAEKKAIQEQDSFILVTVYGNIANVLFYSNPAAEQWQQSINLAEKVIAISRRNGYKYSEEGALQNIAAYYMSQKRPDFQKASQYLLEALQMGDVQPHGKVSLLTVLAQCQYGLKKFEKGDSIILKACAIARELQSKDLVLAVYGAKLDGYKQRGDYKNALHYSELIAGLKDSIKGEQVVSNASQLEFRYETAQKDNEIIKKELQITRQKTILQRRNLIIYSILVGGAAVMSYVLVFFRNRRRTEKQKQEIANWQATLDGEENERKRLAKELHDNIGGTLSTVKMWFMTILEREQQIKATHEYQEALNLLDTALTEVRNTAHHLMPELLLRHGLAEAVRIFCSNMQRATGIEIDYRYLGYIGNLEKGISLIVYRTIQELVQNAVKHAKATNILVQLSMHDKELALTVEDNGAGMDVTKLGQQSGMGLENIRNSIEKLGGKFQISSDQMNAGTTIDIDIQLVEETMGN